MQVTLTTILFVNLLGGALGAAVGAVVNTVVIFVLAESMPKTWAILHTERAGLATARFMRALIRFWPLRVVSQLLIGLTNVLLPGQGPQGRARSSASRSCSASSSAAADDEVIEHEERELIESIIEFGDTVAREVMVPRPDMVTVDERRHRHRRARPGHRPRQLAPPAAAAARTATTSSAWSTPRT